MNQKTVGSDLRGCGYRRNSKRGEKESMNCKFCGAEVEEGAKFCPNCGKNLEEASEKKKCPQCGAELEKDAKFCLKCGCSLEKKAAPKGNKKLIIGIIVLAVVVCVGAGIGLVAHKKAVEKAAYEQRLAEERAADEARKELIKTYEQKAIELNDAINGTKNNFNLLSTMYDTSTDLNTGLLGPDFFTEYVQGLCASEITTEKERKRDIDKIYTELQDIGCEEEEVQELKAAIEDYYFAYCDRYDFLVEGNFSVANFKSKEENSAKNFSSKSSEVQSILSHIFVEGATEANESDEGNESKEAGTDL